MESQLSPQGVGKERATTAGSQKMTETVFQEHLLPVYSCHIVYKLLLVLQCCHSYVSDDVQSYILFCVYIDVVGNNRYGSHRPESVFPPAAFTGNDNPLLSRRD